MKFLVVLVFLLGLACGTEEEETSLQELVELEDDDFEMSPRQAGVTPAPVPPPVDFQLILGNIFAWLDNPNNLNATAIDATLLSLLGPLAALIPVALKPLVLAPLAPLLALKPLKLGGALAALGPLFAIDGLIAMIPTFITGLLSIANGILPIVGLVLLIIYLIDGQPLEALLGVGRSLPVFPSFDLVNNPVVESISDMFFQAMEKYDV